MTATIDIDIWCELSTQWVARNGLEGLDLLQRMRFKAHALRCQRCAAYLPLFDAEDAHDRSEPTLDAESPHLADETLRLKATGMLSQDELALFETAIKSHLDACDYCAERMWAAEELPVSPTPREEVVGRAATEFVVWAGRRAELGWVIDQPSTGLSVWRVSLELLSETLEARLEVEGEDVPQSWRFSLPLSTDEELLPTVVFTPDSRIVRYRCIATTQGNWRATPILTMLLPPWTQLVAVGEDPATMVSLADARRRELALRVPYDGPRSFAAIDSLNKKVVDLLGQPLRFAEAQQGSGGEFKGYVFNMTGHRVGNCYVRFPDDRTMYLVITPAPGEVIRPATNVDDDAAGAPVFESLQETPSADEKMLPVTHASQEAKILAFTPRPMPKPTNGEIIELGQVAGGTRKPPQEAGRRFLIRGRHEYGFKKGERLAKLEVEERDSKLRVRFLGGHPVRIAGAANSLGSTFVEIEPAEDASFEDVLARSLEWSE